LAASLLFAAEVADWVRLWFGWWTGSDFGSLSGL